MKRRYLQLNLPVIRKMRELMEKGETVPEMIRQAEKFHASSVKIKYRLKGKPWVASIEVRRIYR